MKKLRIGFLLPHYSARSRSFMPAVVQAVADFGAVVDIIHPVDHAVDLSGVRVENDLYILRQTSRLSRSQPARHRRAGGGSAARHQARPGALPRLGGRELRREVVDLVRPA